MKFTASVRHQLIVRARAAIDHSLQFGNPVGIRTPRTEPGLVAAVTTYAIPRIAHDWRPVLQPLGIKLEISAVFTHKAPEVEFTSSIKPQAACELADLLIVVDNAVHGWRQAALMQAKMAARRGVVQIKALQARVQLELFQNWPMFNFVEPIYTLGTVDFRSGGSAAQCGVYGVIDRHLVSQPIWSQMPPATVPGTTLGATPLADFIVDLVCRRVGRDASLSLASHWSRTVDMLMSVTYGRYFHDRKSLGPSSFPRGNTTLAFFLQNELIETYVSSDGGLPPDALPEAIPVEEEPPYRRLSILHIRLA